jgi:S1-C subfamily serine protease
MVTNKHVLVGEESGRQPVGIAVKFSGSKQWFQGRLLGVSDVADVGVFKVDIRGGTPRVAGFAPDPQDPQRGDPVAIIGYPLGEDLPMEGQGRTTIADPTLTVGTVSKVLNELIQVDGYGAPGSSGSPIFSRDGRVVAMLYGGNRESQGKIIFAVPGRAVVGYLRQLGVMR